MPPTSPRHLCFTYSTSSGTVDPSALVSTSAQPLERVISELLDEVVPTYAGSNGDGVAFFEDFYHEVARQVENLLAEFAG